MLPECVTLLTLEEMLQASNETPTDTTQGKAQDQWCLVDFGDDDDPELALAIALSKLDDSSSSAASASTLSRPSRKIHEAKYEF